MPLPQDLHEVVQGQAAINNILDNQDVFLLDWTFHVFENTHDSTGFGAIAVAGNRHIVNFQGQVDCAGQVSNKRDRTFECAKQQQVFILIVGGNLCTQDRNFGLDDFS